MPHGTPLEPPKIASSPPSPTPAGKLEEHELRHLIGYQLAQATVVTLGLFEQVVGKPQGMRAVEYTVLSLICGNGAASPAQLAKALGLSPSYITAALDRLQQRGLVQRAANEKDRRGLRLHATAEGAQLAGQTTAALLEAERKAYVTLTPVEQFMLAELLHKLAHSRGDIMQART